MRKGKYIELPAETKEIIARECNVSIQAVYDALNHKTNSKRANAIRAAAMNRGGIEFVPQPQHKTLDKEHRKVNKS
ncbi:hypothetical protein EZS27_012337 [termite gut metagenome]|uniref:Uncharacterized protein n=1 Tax=termite gut metagenome TaxID=433724 RepID=A0A5J4S0W9_9ZZZZ